jgi:hypothetical protein
MLQKITAGKSVINIYAPHHSFIYIAKVFIYRLSALLSLKSVALIK